MAADSTLVKASLQESMSRAGTQVPNLKPLYESNVESTKAYLGIVEDAVKGFKEKEEKISIGREKQLDSFKDIMNKNYKLLFEQEQTMPQEIVNAVDAKVRELQDEFEAVNTYGKRDTVENERARMRISGELKRVINQAIEVRSTLGLLGQDTKMWNNGAIKGDIIAMKRMFNVDNIDKDDNVSVSFVDDKLTFRVINHLMDGDLSTGDVSYNMEQLRKNIPQTDLKADAVILKTISSAGEQAKEHGRQNQKNFDEQEFYNIFSNQVQTKEDFTNLAFRRLQNVHQKSFRNNLLDDMNIAIDTMDVTFKDMFESMDKFKDGVINSKDIEGLSDADREVFENNYKQMIDVLTDVDNENFSLERSRDLLAGYFTNFAQQKYDNRYSYYNKLEFPEQYETKEEEQRATKVGGARGVWDVSRGTYRDIGYFKNQTLDVDKQVERMVPGGVFFDYFGNRYRMDKQGVITGIYGSGEGKNKVIKKYDETLNDGEGGFSEETQTWTKEQFLDQMYGRSENNLG